MWGRARTLWGMRVYEVQPGDTPAKIASRDDMAGCPKCGGIDLVRANPHKESVVHPNGFTTFRELRAGEKLNLPDKWFSKEFDERPKAYFAALPYPDGVTPSTLGDAAAGVLGDYATYDTAVAKLAQLVPMDNQSFSASVDGAIVPLDQSVKEADASSVPAIAAYGQATHASTNWAHQQNQSLVAALAANDQAAAATARLAVQAALTTALSSAQLALQSVYGGGTTPTPSVPLPSSTFPAVIVAAAQAAASAISADPNVCASIAQPGSAANSAVHVFKTAWNAANPNNRVPINTGTYDQATADVLKSVLGSAPSACAPRAPSPSPVPPPPSPSLIAPPQSAGMSTGAVLGIGLIGIAAAGAAIYLATTVSPKKKPTPRPRRSVPRNPRKPSTHYDIGPRRYQDDTIGPWKKDFS